MATVFVPAKGISSRIRRKNVIDLGGQPLIWWTLEACKRWQVVDQVYVATEDDAIAEYARLQGAKIYPLESRDVNDQRTVSQLWQEFCENQTGDQILFHITNPFRKLWELNEAWKFYKSGLWDVVVSVKEERHMICDSQYKPIINWQERMTRLTQHVKPFYITDGSFYISDAEYIKTCKYFEQGESKPYIVSRICGIEIDDMEDLEMARIIANNIDWWSDTYQIKGQKH